MRFKWLALLLTLFLIFIIVGVAVAQVESTCALDAEDVITVVEAVCTHTGENEVCYGNNIVEVDPFPDAPAFTFEQPGDTTDLTYVQSLYLSALDLVQNTWGVAQMRLVTATSLGAQEITLLLYGDVEVDNAVEPTNSLIVETTASVNIRSFPTTASSVIASAASHTEYEAVGRLEDASWVRVRVPETGAVGWISSVFLQPADANDSIGNLDVMERNEPYFGPMQAFYINTGTNLSCDNVATDGLIIQTPNGSARVTILVNEVSIELIPPSGGSATALVQSNVTNGLTVNMLEGSAVVDANESSYFVGTGNATTIGMSSEMRPQGRFTEPSAINSSELLLFPIFSMNSNGNGIIPTNFTDSEGNGVATGSNPGNAQGQGNAAGNSAENRNPGNATGNSSSNNANGTGNATGSGSGNASGSSSGG